LLRDSPRDEHPRRSHTHCLWGVSFEHERARGDVPWQADAAAPQLLTVSLALPPQPTGRVALPAGAQQAVSAAYAGLATVMQPEPGFHLTLQIQLDALPVHDGTTRAPSLPVLGRVGCTKA
jgi:hypothetical protein